MQQALIFLVDTLFRLLFFVFLLRLVLQWARGDFRNPLIQAVVKLTNWLILPLRRLLPPVAKIDTASVVAVLLIALAKVAAVSFVAGAGVPDALTWLRVAGREVIETLLWLYFWAIFIYALLGMIAPGAHSPVLSVLQSICEPVLRPIRRAVPGLAGLDLSPLWALIVIQVFLILLR